MSHFDYGFGSAAADKAYEDAEYASLNMVEKALKDAQTKAKVAYREMILNFQNSVRERNNKLAQIRSLPEGAYKKAKIEEFKAIDDGGWFSPSFTAQAKSMQTLLEKVGAESSLPQLDTLGLIPLAALAVIPTAAWVSGTTMAIAAAALATYFATQTIRYGAIIINPDGVEKADPSITSIFGTQIGSGLKYGIVLTAVGGAAYLFMRGKNAKG